MENTYTPLGLTFASLTKQYLSQLSRQLDDLPLSRYYYPLWLIAQHSGKIGQQHLGELLDADKVAVVRIVDFLEKEGFVHRQVNPADRRCHLLHVTESGRTLIPPIEHALRTTDELFLKLLSEDAGIPQLLARAVQQLKDKPGNRIALYYDKIGQDEE